jgi:hypothetical protein
LLYIDNLPTEPKGIVVIWAIGFGSVEKDGRIGKDMPRIHFIVEGIKYSQHDHGIVLLEEVHGEGPILCTGLSRRRSSTDSTWTLLGSTASTATPAPRPPFYLEAAVIDARSRVLEDHDWIAFGEVTGPKEVPVKPQPLGDIVQVVGGIKHHRPVICTYGYLHFRSRFLWGVRSLNPETSGEQDGGGDQDHYTQYTPDFSHTIHPLKPQLAIY